MAIQSTCRSYYYCLPNKFFQLAQLRKPILGSNFPEISKLINDYKLGTTFNPNKPKEIAESVNRLFFENFHIAEEDHKKFIETYNWNHEEAKLLSLINNFEKLK